MNHKRKPPPLPDSALLAAYQQTHYVIDTPGGSITVRIDQPCPSIALARPIGILTAHNPFSRLLDALTNQSRNERLLKRLRELNANYWTGVARDPSHNWPDEPGFAVAGLSVPALDKIARQFDQRAWVLIDSDHVARLRDPW